MLDEQNLHALRNLIAQHGGAQQQQLQAALEGLEKAIAGQALLFRKLMFELRNHQAGDAQLNSLLTQDSLNLTFQKLGLPKQNPFSVTEAESAVKELSSSIANANNFAAILSTVVKVAKVFI